MCSAASVNEELNKVEIFLNQWNRCNALIISQELTQSTVDTVSVITNELVNLLVQEQPLHVGLADGADHRFVSTKPGPLLSITVRERILEKLLLWVEGPPSQNNEAVNRLRDTQRAHLLSLFEVLMTQSRQNVLSDISVLRPLLQFLFKLSSQLRPAYGRVYGRTLYELCVLLCRDSLFLDHCRRMCEELFGRPHAVFSLLVPLIHQNDSVGDWARDAFLLVLSVSKRDDALGTYLAFESDFCPILAAGLSGLYSSLPKKLVPRHDPPQQDAKSPGGPVTLTSAAFLDPRSSTPCIIELPVGGPSWHQLAETEWKQSTDLRRFLHTLDFCNLVIKICHHSVREQLLYFINSGFLVPVLGSALHQSALDEVVAATAYLELFLRRLTEPSLIKLFLNFIVHGTHDSYSILTSLINRLNANAAVVTDVMYQLGMVTLSLFRTIISFHCEDVMYELVFKHLIPLHHLQPTPSSDESSTQSPKLVSAQSRRRGTRLLDEKQVAVHPSLDRLALDLVQSGDRFISLATTATPDKRFDVGGSKYFQRYIATVTNGQPVPESSLRTDSENRSHDTPTNVINPMEHSTESANGDTSRLSLDDWVLVRSKLPHVAPPEIPDLYAYLKSTAIRIKRRLDACRLTWRSLYVPRLTEPSPLYSLIHTDKDLELGERRDREDAHLTPVKHFTTKTNLSPVTNGAIGSCVDGDSRMNFDNDSSSPVPLTAMSRAQTSSLYQLNYFDDSSEEDNLIATQQDNEARGNLQARSHWDNTSALGIPILSPSTAKYLPVKQKATENDRICTCLSEAAALSVSLACMGPDEGACFTSEQVLNEEQLTKFCNNLNTIEYPWQCPLHFSHLPPVQNNYPAVDPDLLVELDGKLEKLSVPQLDSPKPVESLEIASLRSELNSSLGLNSSQQPDTSNLSIPPTSPRASSISSGSVRRSSSSAPIAGGIGPFLSILLSRLSSLHTNCLFTNLLLTDLFSALASYPCPLLYEFLLNCTALPLRNNVNSVYKCLHSVRSQLLSNAAAIKEWPSLVYRARLYLNCEKRFLADMLIDPEFYSTHKKSRPTSRLSVPNSSTRSASVDRSTERNPTEVRSIWLPTSVESEVFRPESSRRSRFSCGGSSQNEQRLVITPKQSAFPNSLTPLFPVDYPRLKRTRPVDKLKPVSRASFSSTPPSTRIGQHRLTSSTSSAQPKPIWARSARYALSPALSKTALLPVGLRAAIHPDSSGSEDEEMHPVCEPEIPMRTRNLVFAAVVFDEFCHELAALCYNHSTDPSIFS